MSTAISEVHSSQITGNIINGEVRNQSNHMHLPAQSIIQISANHITINTNDPNQKTLYPTQWLPPGPPLLQNSDAPRLPDSQSLTLSSCQESFHTALLPCDSSLHLITRIQEILSNRPKHMDRSSLQSQLDSLYPTLRLIKLLAPVVDRTPLALSLKGPICAQTEQCYLLLKTIFEVIERYQSGYWSLGMRFRWRFWEFCRPSMIRARKGLYTVQQHLDVLLLGAKLLPNKLLASHVPFRSELLYHLEKPSLRHIRLVQITVVDHLGSSLPIPMDFCSWTGIKFLISAYCRGRAGMSFIEQEEYQLVEPNKNQVIGPSEFTRKLKPGLVLEMSIVMWRWQQTQTQCPRCHQDIITSNGSWVECRYCSGKLAFSTTDKEQNGTPRDETAVGHNTATEDTLADNGADRQTRQHAELRSQQGSQHIVSKAEPVPVMGETGSRNEITLFRRIHIITRTMTTRSSAQSHLYNLGQSLFSRFKKLHDFSALDGALSAFSGAARSPVDDPSVRFRAAAYWAKCAMLSHHSSLLEAYACAIHFLPQMDWLGLPTHDRCRELARAGKTIANAAATAIQFGEYATAIEWLEQGHSVVWDQLLQHRIPVDDVQVVNPDLVAQLLQISQQLEHASARDQLQATGDNGRLLSEQVTQQHRQLAEEREKLLYTVRMLPGFESFLLPRSLSQLRAAVRYGPVVILNASKLRCDALILEPQMDNVHHILLDDFTYDDAQELRHYLATCLQSHYLSNSAHMYGKPWRGNTNHEMETILSRLWIHVVKPVLDHLGWTRAPASDLPRIWWCPNGPLAFLPIHAAGLYNTTEPGFKLSEFAVSSYIPTLSTLMRASQPPTPLPFQLLAVAQPLAANSQPLPGILEEPSRTERHLGDLAIYRLIGSDASVEAVVRGMETSSWVHFACVGTQNLASPTNSVLSLADGSCLKLSEIIRMSLPHAKLAFLSSCNTAVGADNLLEEAVHLAAGMLFAGYRGVVGTMWEIADWDAPLVADRFYTYLLKSKEPDHLQAAHALHYAVQRLREVAGEKNFISWIPFIHIGA